MPKVVVLMKSRGEPGPTYEEGPFVSAEAAEQQRHFDCQRYDHCLNLVVLRNWKGWSCRLCPIYKTFTAVPKRAYCPEPLPEVKYPRPSIPVLPLHVKL